MILENIRKEDRNVENEKVVNDKDYVYTLLDYTNEELLKIHKDIEKILEKRGLSTSRYIFEKLKRFIFT